jgi:hypothetical protein
VWVRSAAIRPVPSFAQLAPTALSDVEDFLSSDEEVTEERLNDIFSALETDQPELAAHLGAGLARIHDELAVALGYFLCLAIWHGFASAYPQALCFIDATAIRSVEEALALDEQLRGEDPDEALDSDDVVAMEQPHVLRFIHEHVDAALDVHAHEVDVEAVHAIYRLLIVETLALSYAVSVSTKDTVTTSSEMYA